VRPSACVLAASLGPFPISRKTDREILGIWGTTSGRGKTNNSEKTLSKCHFFHHKCQIYWAGL